MNEVPLGISEEYDRLPQEGVEINARCQDCDRCFMDRMRVMSGGARVLACLCPDCRARRRLRFATLRPPYHNLGT